MQNQYKGEVCLKWGGERGRSLQCPALTVDVCAAPASDCSVSVGEHLVIAVCQLSHQEQWCPAT